MTPQRLIFRRHPFTSGLVIVVMLPALIVYLAKGVIA